MVASLCLSALRVISGFSIRFISASPGVPSGSPPSPPSCASFSAFRSRSTLPRYSRHKTSASQSGDAAVLDQLSHPHLRLDVSLRDTGLINTLLQSASPHPRSAAASVQYAAVILGLVYGYLPFMVLPLYATIEKLDPALLDAAADLGARPSVAAQENHHPSQPTGIVAGCCSSSFLASARISRPI